MRYRVKSFEYFCEKYGMDGQGRILYNQGWCLDMNHYYTNVGIAVNPVINSKVIQLRFKDGKSFFYNSKDLEPVPDTHLGVKIEDIL